MQSQPYYSIVVTSRNDSHGGNIMKRMRLFVKGLIHQSNKFGLPIELIFVEWNPIPGQPRLFEVLPKPAPEDKLRMRFITVPPELHARYKRAEEIPLFQMIAKNVGIRRAKGQFILASNVDLLFSDALFARMAACDLDPNSFYRANRVDIPDGIDENMSFEAQMAYSKAHVIRVNGWDSRFQYVDVRAHGIKELGPISRWITDQIGKRHRRKQPQSEAGEGLGNAASRLSCRCLHIPHRPSNGLEFHGTD